MESVADWQLAQLESHSGYPPDINPTTWNPRGWIQGAFFVGLADLAQNERAPVRRQALGVAIRAALIGLAGALIGLLV